VQEKAPASDPASRAPAAEKPSPVAPSAASARPNTPAPAPDAAKDFVDRARSAAGLGNTGQALSDIDQAIKLEPKNPQVLQVAYQVMQAHGMQLAQGGSKEAYPLMLRSAALLRQLRELQGELSGAELQWLPVVLYNEACGYAQAGQHDKAIQSLGEAIDAGFADLAQLDKDTDLDPLRPLAEYKTWRGGLDAKMLELAREHAKKLIAAHTPFDFDFSLPDLDGKTVSLADFKGKVLVVDFWGTWCGPCRMEIPHLAALHKKYRDAGLEIVGLAYERVPPEKVNETVKQFVEQQGVPYASLIGDEATQRQVPDFQALPTTLFIDRSGKVRVMEVGYRNQQQLEAMITTLLDEKAPEAK
jgi:cytochrome c biogenesis protein CcmG/thiol:disulfide interchange protein DsbE